MMYATTKAAERDMPAIPVYENSPASSQHYVKQLLDIWEEANDVLERAISAFQHLVVDELRIFRANDACLFGSPHDKGVCDVDPLQELLVTGGAEGS
eukprot:CAMPEP_0115055758 /NCGR_PEP_ID=MMETSP0227-20121206/4824_1 /TAXON_ID=89957 /ORGANISM="Polarella glacialis, Strain CCMP 1383" /LENGTH=96 /DNA_ID=CAMNT_0002440373 /DNA_START=308 /DNA_END=597 /DNA_ORIENTATION=-